jgi:hypothetical protein
MTDPAMADATYIEPLNLERMTQIIAKERPDALLPNLGGQTGLNLSSELAKAGILEKYGVQVIGVNVDAIERGEDRLAFKRTMNALGIDMPQSEIAYGVAEAESAAESEEAAAGVGGEVRLHLELPVGVVEESLRMPHPAPPHGSMCFVRLPWSGFSTSWKASAYLTFACRPLNRPMISTSST